ncbi:MAG: hypothetical protein GTO17_03650 [Candidatus Aminicenantes bacterium]|nr:hypothetical protein [Candidatus Aminicenantes bacterium]
MKRKFFMALILFLFIAQSFAVNAQFTPPEITQRQVWEEFLKTAEIVEDRDIGEGVTKPKRLFLKKGDREASGAWKNPSGRMYGFLEGWQYEIAAYEMDKLLGLNLIPPTVEREFKGKKGSLQLWVALEMSDLDRMEQKIDIPPSKIDNWSKMKYLTRAFDSLIANEDRTQENIRYTKDWRTILIDHSRSFRSSKKFTQQLMFGKDGLKGAKLFRVLPREFVEKVKALNYELIKNAVGPYLKDKEIKAILIRKELLLKEIEEMIKEKGEGKVLY